MGGVEEGNCRNFVLKLVPNRKVPAILYMFEEYVVPGSIIVTNGYPSYPRAVTEFGSSHEVVNHSVGFVNAQGAHINKIENPWSHLKHAYRKRGGINKRRIDFFLNEWQWWKRNVQNRDNKTLRTALYRLLKMFRF